MQHVQKIKTPQQDSTVCSFLLLSFPQPLTHSHFHPSSSLLKTYDPINLFHKDSFPSHSLYCTSPHSTSLRFVHFTLFHFTSLYFTSLHFILENVSLHLRLFTSLLTFTSVDFASLQVYNYTCTQT
jgi:hypothetical protein